MRYTEQEERLIILSGIEELNNRTRLKLVNGDLENAVKILPRDVYDILSKKVRDGAKLIEDLEKRGIICVTYFSPGYPEQLKNIDDPPLTLYCKGNIGLFKSNCFSVVGSRRSAANALALCKKLCLELTAAFTVVTGAADGADSAAIEGALESGKIISVLASGFDYCYPSANRGLIEKVQEKGLLISEYPPHMPPRKFNFPVRNRIIAGLSRGTLVVSAGEKSGALITAEYALDYGRDVFAFPYGPGITSGAGCNKLIKNGAYLTENILDIFEAFGLDLKKSEKSQLTKEEQEVYDEIAATGEAFLPVVAQNLKTFTYRLLPVITSLEIKGKITKLGGNRYGII